MNTESSLAFAVDEERHIAQITIDRAARGNVFDSAMVRTFCAYLDEVEQNDNVKVLVIAPAGDDLSTGWDPEEAWQMYRDAPGGSTKKWPSQRARLIALDDLWWGSRGLYSRLLHCRKVTLLEARGRCDEVGLYLTLCSDLTIAARGAVFANSRWAQVGVDQDMSLIIATVGLKRAKELMFVGAEWSGERALRYGLVDDVVDDADLSEVVQELAAVCASIMRDGIVTEKYAVFASLEKMGIGHSFATATVVGASMSNLHFQPGEFNFLREQRDHGTAAAVETARLRRTDR
jgi:enoyl-CoA hydratase/carnithine racemase